MQRTRGIFVRIAGLTPDKLDEAQRALYDEIAHGSRASGTQHFSLVCDDGQLSGPFGLMLVAPVLGAPLQALGSAIRFGTSLSDRVREIAILTVAAATDCAFERHAHERVGRAVGLAEEELQAIREGRFVGQDDDEVAAYAWSRALLADEVPRTQEHFDVLDGQLGTLHILELTVLVGYYRTLSQMLNTFDVQP